MTRPRTLYFRPESHYARSQTAFRPQYVDHRRDLHLVPSDPRTGESDARHDHSVHCHCEPELLSVDEARRLDLTGRPFVHRRHC